MSTYSTSLRAELIANGAQAGTWGDTTNNNFAYIFDTAIAGYQTVSVTASSQALTYVNGPTSSASANQSVYAMLRLTTTTGAAFSVFAPPNSKAYIIYNNSGYTATIYNSTVIGNTTAAGTGVSIANGNKVMVWSDGTSFYEVQAQNLTGTLAIANGGTGQVTANAALNALLPVQTANRLLKSDGTNTSFAQAVLTTDVTGTLPVANGGTGVTTSTGSGNNVLSTSATLTTPTINSPTLTSPALGTPASGNLANCTFPTLNQNTTGTAAGLSSTLAIASGGTGQTTAALAGAALGAVGVGQTWQDVSSSRAIGTTYPNSTGRPIFISVACSTSTVNQVVRLTIDGVNVSQSLGTAGYTFTAASAVVPNGSTYSVSLVSGSGAVYINSWAELR